MGSTGIAFVPEQRSGFTAGRAAPAGLREVTFNGKFPGRSVSGGAPVPHTRGVCQEPDPPGAGTDRDSRGELEGWAGLASAPAGFLGARRVPGGISLR